MNNSTAGSDSAINTPDDDRYGFRYVASSLADSVLRIVDNDGVVIGIEGAWGAGKTSLLNLLSAEIKNKKNKNTHILTISPWMNGDSFDIVESLLVPVASVLNEIEAKKNRKKTDEIKNKAVGIGKVIFDYAKKTSRNTAQLAKFSGNFIPGMSLVGEGMDVFSSFNFDRKILTASDEKNKIEEMVKKLGVNFIIILDDLDRLEPAQSVEVIRLVKSVANFSCFTYIMCYDKKVLSHAIEKGLNVKDGYLYLQKIIQLSFSIPLPEVFDLRIDLINDAPAEDKIRADISVAIDKYGFDITTPREVKLIVNALSFHYPSIRDFVYFPDMCMLFIIKVLRPSLYAWLENYLRLRSVLETGDASINDDERVQIGKELRELLPSDDSYSSNSIDCLNEYVGGLIKSKKDINIVLNEISDKEHYSFLSNKRLASANHYRFYFSFCAPKNVLTDEQLNEIKLAARNNGMALTNLLLKYTSNNGVSNRTWLEYIFNSMTPSFISNLNLDEVRGFLSFFFNEMDRVFYVYSAKYKYFSWGDISVQPVVVGLLKRIGSENIMLPMLASLISSGKALGWIMGSFMLNILHECGIVGNMATHDSEMLLTDAGLEACQEKLMQRIKKEKNNNIIFNLPSMGSYLQTWNVICNDDSAKEWVNLKSKNDTDFIHILLSLRTKIYSENTYLILYEDIVKAFFDINVVKCRLLDLYDNETLRDEVDVINKAFDNAAHF